MALKRMLVIAPEEKTRRNIEIRLRDNLKGIFKKYSEMHPGEIDVQLYSSIYDSSDRGYRIGLGGELFVVFDNRLLPNHSRRDISIIPLTDTEKLRIGGLKASLKTTQGICDTLKIPCIMYFGEIEKGKEMTLRRMMQDSEPEILSRLMQENKMDPELDYGMTEELRLEESDDGLDQVILDSIEI